MNKALVLGATGGIGQAVAQALSVEYEVTGLSRARGGLDWREPSQAEELLLSAAQSGPFQMIFDATGALEINGIGPEKQLAAIDADAMAAQFAVNAIGPALDHDMAVDADNLVDHGQLKAVHDRHDHDQHRNTQCNTDD